MILDRAIGKLRDGHRPDRSKLDREIVGDDKLTIGTDDMVKHLHRYADVY